VTPPRRIAGRYDLGDTLGFGGMSEVHLARDNRLNRDVAIKILRADLARDPSFYERFKREAQNAASLNHPTIVQVYDTGEADTPEGPLPYIVMEYVDGETLRDVLRRDGHIAPQAAMTWMADVCAALDFSHRNDIVHRDMKPANVMLSRTGEIKVMDFGIARALSDPSAGITQTAAVIGTAQYLSPEQARGESVDARSDVYAAGCVLFELLVGEPPFTGDSPVSVAYQHVREDPPTPSAVLETVPPELDSIVLKAIAKNPANRYQSAGEMRQDLIRVLAGHQPEAPRILGSEERVGLDSGAPDRPSTAAASADDGAATVPVRRGHRRAPEPENRKRRAVIGAVAALVAVLLVVGIAYLLLRPDQVSRVQIPSVAGKTVDDAQLELKKLGFDVTVNKVYDNTVPADKVIDSAPASGSDADKGSQVVLRVSQGPKISGVPDVTGKPEAQAVDILTKAGFTVAPNRKKSASPTVKVGMVMSTNPAANTNTPQNQPITLEVSTGPEKVKVPDVTNTLIAQAKPNLEGLGFVVQVTEQESTQPVGTVLSQTPPGGTDAAKGSTMALTVAKSAPISMPNLVGKDINDAKGILLAAGFTGQIQTDGSVKSGLPWDDNKVWSTTPAAGTPITSDGTVMLRYRTPR
jgi:beta-lactam-binding protein with PASTA domain